MHKPHRIVYTFRTSMVFVSGIGVILALVYLANFFRLFFQDFHASAVSAATTPPKTIKVLVIQYFPQSKTKAGVIDDTIVGPSLAGQTIVNMRKKTAALTTESLNALIEGSRYHAYTNPSATPYIKYEQYGAVREYLEPLPPAATPLNPAKKTYRADFFKVLNREKICDLVDKQGVRQVWLWGYHHGQMEPVESNMSMGRRSQKYWNHGSYGDISNSEQTNDMPQCENTYVLYNYNYQRGTGEVLEDHMHQLERYFNFLQEYDPADVKAAGKVFWNKFVGDTNGDHLIDKPGCGWTHFPPNTINKTEEYGWYNKRKVATDCMDWKPDGSGKKTVVTCETWAGVGSNCPDDGGTQFKIWWMRSLPGHNNGIQYMGRSMKNWWDAVVDFDGYLAAGPSLVGAVIPTPPQPPPPPAVPQPDLQLKLQSKVTGGKSKTRLVTSLSKADTSLSGSTVYGTIYKTAATGRVALHECYIKIWDDYLLATFPSATQPSDFCRNAGEEYKGVIGYLTKASTTATQQPVKECFDEVNLDHVYVTKTTGCDTYAKARNITGKVRSSWVYGYMKGAGIEAPPVPVAPPPPVQPPAPDLPIQLLSKTVGGKTKTRLVTSLSKADTSLKGSAVYGTAYKAAGTGRVALHECYIKIWDDYMLLGSASTTQPADFCRNAGEEYKGVIGYAPANSTAVTTKLIKECFDEANLNHVYVTTHSGCDDYAVSKNLVGRVKSSWVYGYVK